MSRQREPNASRIDHVMAVGLKMGVVSVSDGGKGAPVGTKPVEPAEAGNERLWRAMMEQRKLSEDDEFRPGIKMKTLPNIDAYIVRLEWIPVKPQQYAKTRDIESVIMSCVENFGESTTETMHYSASALISKDQPRGFYNTQFVRLYPRGPQALTLSQWYLKESLKLIDYVPQSELHTSAGNQLQISPPRQLATVTNDEFYQMSFDWKNVFSAMSKNFSDVATAIQSGKVLGSDETCILRTYQSTESYHSISFWDNVSRDKKIGAGSFNKVYSVNHFPEILTQKFSSHWTGRIANYPHWTGRIVIRESKPDQYVAVEEVLKEMYLTGYASHYELGPRLLASYYIAEPTLDNKWVSKTVSASVAWNGSCNTLIKTVSMLNRPTSGSGLPSDFCIKFGELFVDLAKRAAHVGLFHCDIKPDNMLFFADDAWDDALDSEVYPGETIEQKRVDRSRSMDSLKICMTDFDPNYCHLLPPQDRKCNCIVGATALMFMAFIRCVHGDDKWRSLRDGIMGPLLLAIEPKSECNDGDDAPCKYLTYTLMIEERSIETQISNAKKESITATMKLKDLYIDIYTAALRQRPDASGELHQSAIRGATTDELVHIVTNLLHEDAGLNTAVTIAPFLESKQEWWQFILVAKYVNLEHRKDLKEQLTKALKSVERRSKRLKSLDDRLRALQNLPEAMRDKAKDDFPQDYNGQKLEASRKWQRHISHYIAKSRFFSDTIEWEPCLKVEEGVSLYDQVFDYALLDKPMVRPNDKSTKRKLDNVMDPVAARQQGARVDQDVQQEFMAAVDAENLMIFSQELYNGEPDDRFHYVETAMKTIVTKLNDVGHGPRYMAELLNRSPALIPALMYLNGYILTQPILGNLEMQEKVVNFLYDVFFTRLVSEVGMGKVFRSLGSIDKLYTNLGRIGDDTNVAMRVRARARRLATVIELPDTPRVPQAVTPDST